MSESLINQLVKLILENNEVEITKFLEKNPEYDLFSPIDNYNNNIFHKIAFHNSISIFNIFENHLIKTKSKNEIEELINKKKFKRFNPITLCML